MPAANTYRTLNDYRLLPESTYENESHSRLGAGALVAAIFLGTGAYFFYPMLNRPPEADSASGVMKYQAPTATDGAAPGDTFDDDAMPDASNTTATSPIAPSTDTRATGVFTPDPAMSRTATESKPGLSSTPPVQRTGPSAKSLTKSAGETAAPSVATSEATAPAPAFSLPAAADPTPEATGEPLTNQAEVPADAVPDDAIDTSSGG